MLDHSWLFGQEYLELTELKDSNFELSRLGFLILHDFEVSLQSIDICFALPKLCKQ
jgi:hypothetical protein